MNKPRLRKLIRALRTKAAQRMFDIEKWADVPDGAKPVDEAFRNGGTCGTTACVAGLAAAIEPKVWKWGKRPVWSAFSSDSFYLIPKIGKAMGEEAFAKWAEIDKDDATCICIPGAVGTPYPDLPTKTTPKMVANVLDWYVRTGELVSYSVATARLSKLKRRRT